MFLEYYNLCTQPFGVTPDPRFLYMSRTHREALASLWYGIQQNRGFMALVAQPGMGKTTLLFRLLEHLRDSARTVFLFQTQCNSHEVFRYLLHDLGITPGPDLPSMHQQLNEVLLAEGRNGRRFVFVIDEAQNLEPPVLETIRLLSDFETSRCKLLQIILAGQPQLATTLVRPDMEQLRQRISNCSVLRAFSPAEVAEYVQNRLEVAGHQGEALFTPDALALVAKASKGIPRNINSLCFSALSTGFALRRHKIDQNLVKEAMADQDLSALVVAAQQNDLGTKVPKRTTTFIKSPTVPRLSAVATVLVLVALLVGWSPTVSNRTNPVSLLPSSDTRSSYGLPAISATATAGPETTGMAGSAKSVRPDTGIVVVEGRQTLELIAKEHLGDYNQELLAKIRALNPEILDPDRIRIGQRIHLPERPRGNQSAADETTLPAGK